MDAQVDNWIEFNGEIVSMSDAKRGAAFIKSVTPPQPLKQRRRKWSDNLREAEWWIAEARKAAKRGDYKQSRSEVLTACFILDNACQIDTETPA